ncbi:MAG: Hsp20/alpha crystallin family protein [Alkalispirochaetaceae bacterium]
MNYLTRNDRRNRGLSLLDDFDRLFENVFSGVPTYESTQSPVVDVREESDRYVLEAELPGMSEKDVDVQVEDNMLTIRSNKQEEREERNEEGYLVRERRNRTFSRSFLLPKDVDREKVDARFKNGLLTLTMPKSAESKARQIQIKAE